MKQTKSAGGKLSAARLHVSKLDTMVLDTLESCTSKLMPYAYLIWLSISYCRVCSSD